MYIQSKGKKLRCGYTTGSCAAAAAKGAALYLYRNIKKDKVTIDTPSAIDLEIPINSIKKEDDYVLCSVIKDAGDDPDITDGIEIWAKVKKKDKGYTLKGGIGVGIVQGEGLYVDKGEYAINPVPRQMIKKEVLEVIPINRGIEVTIFVPQGEEIAKKTFNPRLNIHGGISILGTTGIVRPMSEDALKDSIELEIKQKIASGNNELLFAFGNMGEKFANKIGLSLDNSIIISNYVGHALDCVVNQDIKRIIIVGHIGKLGKVAASCMNTHSKVCGIRQEILALELALIGAPTSLVRQVYIQPTTEASIKIIDSKYNEIYKNIVLKIKKSMEDYVYNEFFVDVVMFHGSSNMELLYSTLPV